MAATDSSGKPIREADIVTNPKGTLSLTGVTMNAMALIAPGAFLWATFQIQASNSAPNGTSTAYDMWAGIGFALILAFLTAIPYAQMAKVYPEAGYGSAYYFAEKAFLDKENASSHKWARISKLITGWAAHLFYWVYPGVMVAFMATLISYIAGLFKFSYQGNPGLSIHAQMVIAVIFAFVCGFIAVRGISGSTLTSIIVNIVQWVTLVFFSILAIAYRVINPDHANFYMMGSGKTATQVGYSSALDVIRPHGITTTLLQGTIAILILVGFESCTALGADAKNPKHSVPRGVLLALIVQGLFAYLFEYFAACYSLSDKYTYVTAAVAASGTPGTAAYVAAAPASTSYGMNAAGLSSAPIGDLMTLFGNSLLHGTGFILTVIMSLTVAAAVLGTTLACINTAVRVTYAMGQDDEVPEFLGLMHGKYNSPHVATWVLTVFAAGVGVLGVVNTTDLGGIGIASNLGTFILYSLICIWTIIGFSHRPERNILLHVLIPLVGLAMNILMVATILWAAFASGGTSAIEAKIALGFAAGWGVISVLYVLIRGAQTGKKLIAKPVTS